MPFVQVLSRAARLLAIPCSAAIVMEVGLRLAHFEYMKPSMRSVIWSRAEDEKLRSPDGLHQVDSRQIWKPRPGARIPWCVDERVNADGYRGPLLAREKTPGVLRVAFLGPNASFGWEMEWVDTYHHILAQTLAARGVPAEVMCTGVMNSTVRQGLERYRNLVRPFHPDLVVSAYGGVYDYQQAWHAFTDNARIEYGCGMLLKPKDETPWLVLREQARVMHLVAWLGNVYNGAYWEEAETDMRERRLDKLVGLPNAPMVRRVPLDDFHECLQTLCNEVRADGASFFLLSMPRRPSLYDDAPMLDRYARVVEQVGREEGVPVLRGLNVYLQNPSEGITTEDLFVDNRHLSECAHELLAQYLANEILQRLPEIRR